MSKTKSSTKSPGRLKQLWQVLTMTVKADKSTIGWLLLAFLGPLAVGIVIAVLISRDNIFGLIAWILLGLLTGILVALIVLGRRAEAVAYTQIEGKPGAVGAVLRSTLKRSWQGSELPVAVNPRTQDAVYRAIGRPGIVLIGEGDATRVQRLLNDEQVKIRRVVPNIDVNRIVVGDGSDGTVRLRQINRRLAKFKPRLTRAEVAAVANRLTSLEHGYGVPKGMDPNKVRPSHKGQR
ncbi:DUF4191 family protein [Pseudoclavibacter sp. CFCC 13796]|uniref:DUF4191 domain-containing protein n=1 Tax=Pseudoclavibacter sp. CFCC 13796 TaxID=2615179 RepID=UPI001301322B|nr:DUF4191 domain-containing protein [Pseudoclavibacter sp. CFCC 13796]KAB1661725.1 DUF4191 family protein [Pseudoclavibacter sp. CFCC 13796]